jgi:hypothetical protein
MVNVHHATKKAADKDLAEGTITEESRAAVLAGEMTLQEARNIGAEGGPTATDATDGPGTATETPQEGREDAAGTPPHPHPASLRTTVRGFACAPVETVPVAAGSCPATTCVS